MAGFGRQRILGRALALILIIVALVVAGLFWFDYLGLIDAKPLFSPALRLLRLPTRSGQALAADLPTLLDDERWAKQLEAVGALRQELDQRDASAAEREAAIEAMAQELKDREEALAEREISFNSLTQRYDNRKANVEQNARYLTGMPPADAVKILVAMDDQTVIDVLRSVEELASKSGEASVVAYWLSLMPAARSAEIQRKMSAKPASLD